MSLVKRSRCIFVSGFAPFGQHVRNASWETVKLLEGLIVETETSVIEFQVAQVPVEYQFVIDHVPLLHDQKTVDGNSRFAAYVHVGVGPAGAMRLETEARQAGYEALDEAGCLAPVIGNSADGSVLRGYPFPAPQTETCTSTFRTPVNVPKILFELQNKFPGMHIQSSSNAGLYLCEYIYFASLAEANLKLRNGMAPVNVLFIHVPPENCPHMLQSMANVIRDSSISIVDESTRALDQQEKYT